MLSAGRSKASLLIISLLTFLLLPISANAATYVLTDVAFDDLGTAAGSFDAEVGTLGSIDLISYDITTYEQNGSVRNVYQGGGGAAQNGIRIFDQLGNNLVLFWDGAQLDPGVTQTLPIDTTGFSCEQQVGGQFCDGAVSYRRLVTAGSVNLVPIPAAAWLFLSALGGLAIIKRKRR